MTDRKGASTDLSSAAIFILLMVASFVLLHRTSPLENIRLNYISHRVMAFIGGTGESIRNYFLLSKINDGLAEENHFLRETLRETGRKNSSSATDISTDGFEHVPARVIKLNRNSSEAHIILDKGYADGIKPNSGIITGKGVIGIVDAVEEHYCYGISFLNPRISISSRIGRDGIVSPMRTGKLNGRARLTEIPLHTCIQPGDTVYTSGYSTLFPPDIPVGITGETSTRGGAFSEVEVILFQDYSTLKYVTVTHNPWWENLHQDEEEAE